MRTTAAARTPAVSHPYDPAERQAERAADAVARGGSVVGWSFGSVAPSAAVHREEAGAPKSDDEKLKEAAGKAAEAALETEAGKQLQAAVKADTLVRKATDFLGTTTGKVVAGGVVAAGVGGLAAAEQPLPFQAPEIPLDRITPGLSAKVTVEGPLHAPTFAGLALTYREQGPAGKAGRSAKESSAAQTAKLKADLDLFTPRAVKAQEQADEQAAIAAYLASQARRFGAATLIPLTPGAAPRTVAVPEKEEPAESAQTPVQRSPEPSTAAAPLAAGGPAGAVRGSGRALDPATRRRMEARFGYDFADVRIHDSAPAAAAARAVQASAFTIGTDIVFGSGRFDPGSLQGTHLLAHELAHVVQQRQAGPPGAIHRRSLGQSLGILLGISEGSFSDAELRAYLDQITATGRIDGAYDADNKARAIVRRWQAGTPGWDLLGPQKALLIDEMLDGPTLDDDERAILDLLRGSDAGDLRAIFADPAARMQDLDSDFHFAEHDQLLAFLAGRFAGGRAALLAGRVEVTGPTVPATAPVHAFDPAAFEARLDSDRSDTELIALVEAMPPADRGAALQHLMHQVWPAAKKEMAALKRRALGLADGPELEQVRRQARPVKARIAKAERILQHSFAQAVPATKGELLAGTAPADPALAEQLQNVLRPKQYTAEAKAEAEAEAEAEDREEAEPAPVQPKDKAAAAPPPVPARAAFHDPDKYRAEVAKALPGVIDGYYTTVVSAVGPRAANEEIEQMAVPAKDETDAVFGQFYDRSKRPPLKFDRAGKPGNLHSWYDTADRELKAMSPGQRRSLAQSWALYYFQADETIRLINDTYSASPKFDRYERPKNAEARILTDIARQACTDAETVRKLVEARRAWGGMAAGSQVFVDLFHNPDATKDRTARWEMFQTLIHEYLHTLAHRDYEAYAQSFGANSEQWNTLIEGVDNVLDEVVWARIAPRVGEPALRIAVEGAAHAKLPPMQVHPPGRYDSYEEAFRLTGIVGIGNVVAAYFLGLVDRISVPKAKAKKKAP
jgi:hypothetical protein